MPAEPASSDSSYTSLQYRMVIVHYRKKRKNVHWSKKYKCGIFGQIAFFVPKVILEKTAKIRYNIHK